MHAAQGVYIHAMVTISSQVLRFIFLHLQHHSQVYVRFSHFKHNIYFESLIPLIAI